MSRQRIEMAITGKKVSPEEVSISDLVEVLSHIEEAVLSYARAQSDGDLPEEHTLSLGGIQAGSEALVFSVPDPYVPAIAHISQALHQGDYGELPKSTYAALSGLSSTVARHGWGFEIRECPKHRIVSARLDPERVLPRPPDPAILEGTTTIHGRCLRVGGATQPKAEIRLTQTGKILNVTLSEDAAKKLAVRLYEEVILEGVATWSTENWEIERFSVSRPTEYRSTDPDLAFKELAEAAEGCWEGVDANAYVRGLRCDE